MEAGRRRLSGDTESNAYTSEVKDLKEEHGQLEDLVAELSIREGVLLAITGFFLMFPKFSNSDVLQCTISVMQKGLMAILQK
jgi:hypothetical protein